MIAAFGEGNVDNFGDFFVRRTSPSRRGFPSLSELVSFVNSRIPSNDGSLEQVILVLSLVLYRAWWCPLLSLRVFG